MTAIDIARLAALEFIARPVDGGQIVERSYALDWQASLLVRRSHDRSDGTTSYDVAEVSEDSHDDFDPANGSLPKRLESWRSVFDDAAEIREALSANLIDWAVSGDSYEHETRRLRIYWDRQDRANKGWAYSLWTDGHEESGSVDSVDDLPGLIESADER